MGYVKANKTTMYYKVTLRRVRETIVAVEVQQVLHMLTACVCSLSYTASNAHAPYCQVWPAPLYNIFPHFLICGTIFFWGVGWVGGGVGWGEVLPTKCVCFDFLYKFV